MDLFRVICCIMGILIFIITVGFFGLIVSKHCVFGGKEQVRSSTPVLDKFQKDAEKAMQDKK